MHELFDRVAVSPVIQDVRQIWNDRGDTRCSERLSQITVPRARTRDAVSDDSHFAGRFGAWLVDVYMDIAAAEFDHIAMHVESRGLGSGGGTKHEYRRQRKYEQTFNEA